MIPASLVSGVLAAQLYTSVPAPVFLYPVSLAAGAALVSRRARWIALAVLACCWTLHCFQARLDGQLDPSLAGVSVTLDGTIVSIPRPGGDSVGFIFQPDPQQRIPGIPSSLLVRWYRDPPTPVVGESWRLELKLMPPWGRVNFQGSDKERWLFVQGIGGLGTVRAGHLLSSPPGSKLRVNSIRERLVNRISFLVEDEHERGIIQALATADRSGLSHETNRVFRATGTSHLLAISGLHIGLAAAGGMWLSRIALLILPFTRAGSSGLVLILAGGLLSAVAYSALAGFGTPTVRAVLMFAAVLMALCLRRSIHPMQAWAISLAVILVMNPFSALSAGTWFSFIAVAALLWVAVPRTGETGKWKSLVRTQAAVTLVLLPVSAFWFYSFSPAGFAANLVAIPLVSIGVVPLVLAGVAASPFSELMSGWLWQGAAFMISLLVRFLQLLEPLQGPWALVSPPALLQSILAMLGALICLLPRGIPFRWNGLFLLLPLFLPPGQRNAAGTITAEMLDVGQGTAILVTSADKTLLYDSGPGDGQERNLLAGVLAPALARLGGNAPDLVIISHADLDHAGGLQSLLVKYPDAEFVARLPDRVSGVRDCQAPMAWDWPEATIRVLHPTAWLPYLGNDSSCVVSFQAIGGSLLLSGDITGSVENRLIIDGLQPHKLLLVPHHGSLSSSTGTFIESLAPELAVATASLGNRFQFPRPEIRARYESRGVPFLSTGDCGAIRIQLNTDGGWTAYSARSKHPRVWRRAAAENCP